jgi:predicted ATPase with chaperone activity
LYGSNRPNTTPLLASFARASLGAKTRTATPAMITTTPMITFTLENCAGSSADQQLHQFVDVGQFSHVVVLRVAWTLADLAGLVTPGADQVAEALGMRLQRAAA